MSSHENSASLRRRLHNEEGEDVKSKTTFSDSSRSASTKEGVLRWSEKRVWTFALAFRAANALLVQTYFNPDEHWQSLEVAHRIVFGYGYLTWEWKEGIRSYLHPLLFAFLYRILAFLHLDKPLLMAKAPRLFQSLFASIGDLYMYKLSKLIFDEHVAKWALFSQFTNWFMFFCITRTFSNCLETVLTLMGIFYWFSSNSSSRKLGLFLAALTCAVRPTSAITWLYIGLLDLFKMQSRFHFHLFEVFSIGSVVLALSSLLDWWMYESFVLVPLNFLKFNFLSSGGNYYGTHPWHWYFTQGFPSMLLTFLPHSLIAIFHSKEWRISGLIAWVLGVYSFLGHKEFRFVLPVLPIALMFSGYHLDLIAKPDRSGTESKKFKPATKCLSNVQLAVLFLLVTNVPMALYMSLIHQRGSEDVMIYLSKEANKQGVKSVLFLMPCHSTPYYSTLHNDLPMRFLDCTPSSNRATLPESDFFLKNPHAFALSMFNNSSFFPSHVVLFSSEEPYLQELLISYSFTEVRRFFHAHFKVDRDLQASVVVYSQTIS